MAYADLAAEASALFTAVMALYAYRTYKKQFPSAQIERISTLEQEVDALKSQFTEALAGLHAVSRDVNELRDQLTKEQVVMQVAVDKIDSKLDRISQRIDNVVDK